MNADIDTAEAWQLSFLDALDRGESPPGLADASNGISARQRFQVYVNQTRIGLSDTLAAIYPAVCRLVGDEFFKHLAALYVERYPLRTANLNDYGVELPEFIAVFDALDGLPYLADVARLEWACHQSLHAGHGQYPGESESLCLAPHVRLLHSPYPVGDIWDFALREHGADERLNINDAAPSYLLVSRPQLDVEVRALDASDWLWLANVAATADGRTTRHRYWLAQGILGAATKGGNDHERTYRLT